MSHSLPHLTVELVPPLAWGRNVRAVVATNTWDALRWPLGASQMRRQFPKHMGHATKVGHGDEALAHLAAVNGWTARQAKAHTDRAFAIWEGRAGAAYALDVSRLERYIPPTKIHMDWLDNPRTWVGCRLDATMWANRLLDSDAIILDTETTGLLGKVECGSD